MVSDGESTQSSSFCDHKLFGFFGARLSWLEAEMNEIGEPEDDVSLS